MRSSTTPAAPTELPAHCARGPIRLFVGITSRSATAAAQVKRDAIRRTWLRTIKESYADAIDVRFLLAQPDTEVASGAGAVAATAALLAEEVAQHGDISVLPGLERYRELPAKTLRLLRYALSSPCKYTHVLKTDDDVFLRPQGLLKLIATGQHDFALDIQHKNTSSAGGGSASGFDTLKLKLQRGSKNAPWMAGMYVGKVDFNQSGEFPGWAPNRTVTSKWYLSEGDLPDADCPLGLRWLSGWGYMLSRDLAEAAVEGAVAIAAAPPQQ